MDVYVWLPSCDAGALNHFIERYVDRQNPGDDRLTAFIRAYIEGAPSDDDRAGLADLGRGDAPDDGSRFTSRHVPTTEQSSRSLVKGPQCSV